MGAQPQAAWQASVTEDQLHSAVVKLLGLVLPETVFWTAIEAGGFTLSRSGRGRMARHAVKAGTPDLYVLHRGRCIWIELKKPKGIVSPEQREAHEAIRRAGGNVEICRSVEDVIAALTRYQVPMRQFHMGDETYGCPSSAARAAA